MYGRTYNNVIALSVDVSIYSSRRIDGLTTEEFVSKLLRNQREAVEIVKSRFRTRRVFSELDHLLAEEVPDFNPRGCIFYSDICSGCSLRLWLKTG